MKGKSFNNKGGYTEDNEITLIRGGAAYFNQLEDLIDASKDSIQFQVYIFEGDETGRRIADALIRAALRKVSVHLLLDGYASRSLPSEIVQRMKDAGVVFRWFQPLFKSHNFFVGRRMHHKIFVSDALYSLVGGLNISDRYNDMPGEPAWLDWAVFVTGQTSVELYHRCVQMWFRRPPAAKSITYPKALTNQCLVRVRINDWVRNKNQISRSYLEILRQSQQSITFMSSYFMPGRVFRKNLRLASERGIRIRIILTKISDISIAKQAERFFYPWLLRRNIEIYEYRQEVLHGKMAVSDGQWVTVGSYNFNDLSAYASVELNLDIHDKQFSQGAELALDKIIENDCDRITKESLNQSTHWWNLIVYRLAYLIGRLSLFAFRFPYNREKPT